MSVNFLEWPVVPELERTEQGKPLYYSQHMDPELWSELKRGGWNPIDIRLLPQESEGDRKAAVMSYLEGVRVGSIIPERNQFKFVELEARVLGLLRQTTQVRDETKLTKDDEILLLSFAKRPKGMKIKDK